MKKTKTTRTTFTSCSGPVYSLKSPEGWKLSGAASHPPETISCFISQSTQTGCLLPGWVWPGTWERHGLPDSVTGYLVVRQVTWECHGCYLVMSHWLPVTQVTWQRHRLGSSWRGRTGYLVVRLVTWQWNRLPDSVIQVTWYCHTLPAGATGCRGCGLPAGCSGGRGFLRRSCSAGSDSPTTNQVNWSKSRGATGTCQIRPPYHTKGWDRKHTLHIISHLVCMVRCAQAD